MSSPLTATLNAAQAHAVTLRPQPALILAGAGSGKTRVITHRIAWLIDQGLSNGGDILAMTFTNRAALEMRERVASLCDRRGGYATITTFHSACARWLRRYARLAGLPAAFSIYDTDDQRDVLKRCAKDLSLPHDRGALRDFLQRIDDAHNRALSPHDLDTMARSRADEEFADLYRAYHVGLTNAGAVDFGTLITTMLHLLESDNALRARFHQDFQHILVDEFQDTNTAQYRLLRALAPLEGSVMVVGDDDQSIYGWRGAEVENVRRFVHDYAPVEIIKLEQNYRSVAPILRSAHHLVQNLEDRMPKELQAVREGEQTPLVLIGTDDREEADQVSTKIRDLVGHDGRTFGDIAVFYRTNAQSRVLEQRLRADGIPYRLIGSVGYFDRKEIKDVLAWLRLVSNPADDMAFERVIKSPPRGIGAVTLENLYAVREHNPNWIRTLDVWLSSTQGKKSRRSRASIEALVDMLRELSVHVAHLSPAELIEAVIERSGYLEWLQQSEADSFDERLRNVHELLHAAREHVREHEDASVETFLESVALVSSRDEGDEGDSVQLMTVHTSKGLEFPVVFVTGLEEDLFPLARRDLSADDEAHQREERRLAYVALTRAEDRLFLSAVQRRQRFGSVTTARPSVFLQELVDAGFVAFDPASVAQDLGWADRGRPAGGGWERPLEDDWGVPDVRASAPSRADDLDQRPWSERTQSPSAPYGGVQNRASQARHARMQAAIPEDGVIFDDSYYPEARDEAAEQWAGRQVQHKLFGLGTVVSADLGGHKVRLTISFPKVGEKTVIADYVQVVSH